MAEVDIETGKDVIKINKGGNKSKKGSKRSYTYRGRRGSKGRPYPSKYRVVLLHIKKLCFTKNSDSKKIGRKSSKKIKPRKQTKKSSKKH